MATPEQIARGQVQAAENAAVNVSLTPLEQPKFTNLKLQRDIILNNFIFNTIDDSGIVWVITDIEGWWNGAPAEVPDISRGWGDGSYDVQGRYASRSLVLRGSFLTPDPALVQSARDRLMDAVNLVYRGAWLLTGSDPIRASWVRLVEGPIFTTVNARGRTDFEIPLRAPDPIKYSWNDSQPDGYEYVEFSGLNYNIPGSGVGVVENIGNYNVPCILEISGPIVGPSTLYNRTTDQLIIITSSFGGSLSARVENKQLSFDESTLQDIATLTTREPHGFTAESNIFISGVGEPFDGNYTIESVPTETTLTYVRLPEVAVIKQVAYRTLQSNVATLETTTDHGFSVGDEIVIANVDNVFNGRHAITSVESPSEFSYSTSRVPSASITGRILVSNVATLTTSAPHGFLVGEQVNVSGIDSTNFNGTYIISSVSRDGLQFSYAKSRTDSRLIINSSLSNAVATITTAAPHGFIVGEGVTVSDVNSSYDGSYEIESTPTDTTFTYARVRDTRVSIVAKSASNSTATLTTSSPHKLSAGDQVTVSNVDSTFNGTYTVSSTPSATAFTYFKVATVPPTQVIGGYASANGRWIIRKRLIGNVVTLTTLGDHGILVGESVTVSNVGSPFDGTHSITQVANNTFSYVRTGANVTDVPTALTVSGIQRISPVAVAAVSAAQSNVNAAEQAVLDAIKQAEGNIAAARKSVEIGEAFVKYWQDEINRLEALIEEEELKDNPNQAKLTLLRSQLNTARTNAIGGAEQLQIARDNLAAIEAVGILDTPGVVAAVAARNAAVAALSNAEDALPDTPSATATVTTAGTHGFSDGDQVFIGGIFDPTFNGFYSIAVISPTQFSYNTEATYTVISDDEENPFVEAGEGAYVVKTKVTYSGNIPSALVTDGIAEVSGSLPFASTTGTATVSENIQKRLTNSGVVVKKNNIQFTPGVIGGVASIDADILEIDTQNREVAFNGELVGARAKIDVLADFIKLAPGNNTIEFEDAGNPESQATCKIYYRSGWLA